MSAPTPLAPHEVAERALAAAGDGAAAPPEDVPPPVPPPVP